MRKGHDEGEIGGKINEKEVTAEIVSTNVVASRPPNGYRLQRRPLVPKNAIESYSGSQGRAKIPKKLLFENELKKAQILDNENPSSSSGFLKEMKPKVAQAKVKHFISSSFHNVNTSK